MTESADLAGWSSTLLRGRRAQLRALTDDDLPKLAAWWNDAETGIMQQERVAPRPRGDVQEMFRSWSTNADASAVGYAISSLDGGLVGHLALWGLTMPARIATLAVIIGSEHQGQGFGRSATEVALRLAFEEMGANKVELRVWSYNQRAIALYTSLGFVEEGRRRQAVFHRSGFHDEVSMGMLVGEYVATRK